MNALRQNAAEFVVQRSAAEAAAEGVTLAPARAVRKRRGKDGRAFTAEYRTASGILHEPGWVLMSIDAECAQNLMAWAVMVLGEVTPRQFVPTVPTLGPDEALTVGAIFELARWWPRVGVVKSVDLMLQAVGTAPEIVMKSDLVKLAAALRKYPEWRARIRRCDYEGGRSEGCYRARLAAGGSLERGGREVWWPSARRLSASATSRGCDRARRAEHRSRGA